MFNSYVTRSGELLDSQRVFFIGGVKLLNPATNRPLRSKLRQIPSDLVAVNAVAAEIGATALRVLDAAPGYDFLHHSGYVPNLIIFFGTTDIECLVMDQLSRRLKNGNERAADIFHMDKWAPRRSVARDQHL